jgi:hypothetical protein
MDAAEMLRLFESHREAKAAPDIDAILETFVSDCFLETVPLGFEVRARTRSGRHIEAQFFTGVPRSGSRRRADGGRRRRHRRLGHVAQNDFHTTHPPLGGRPGLTSPDRPGLRHREQPHSLGGRRAPLTRALSAPPTVRNPFVQAKPGGRGSGIAPYPSPLNRAQSLCSSQIRPRTGNSLLGLGNRRDAVSTCSTRGPGGRPRPGPESRRQCAEPARLIKRAPRLSS